MTSKRKTKLARPLPPFPESLTTPRRQPKSRPRQMPSGPNVVTLTCSDRALRYKNYRGPLPTRKHRGIPAPTRKGRGAKNPKILDRGKIQPEQETIQAWRKKTKAVSSHTPTSY